MHCQWEENPFPPTGDAAYRQRSGQGPSHGHVQHAEKKFVKIAHVIPEISCRTHREAHRHADRQTYSSQYFATAPAGEVITVMRCCYALLVTQ